MYLGTDSRARGLLELVCGLAEDGHHIIDLVVWKDPEIEGECLPPRDRVHVRAI